MWGSHQSHNPASQFLTTIYHLLKLFLPFKLSLKIQKLRKDFHDEYSKIHIHRLYCSNGDNDVTRV